MATVQLKIITPEATVLETDSAEHVVLPGASGELGVLPGHIAMVTGLQVGEVRAECADETARLSVSGGFAEVLSDRITVLADTAERSEQIDIARAREAQRRAEAHLGREDADADVLRAQAALARAINRLRVAGHTEE
jgi:F-type H+-transporting ATPase subunit epsilon